jgi:hypothetical protein
VLDALINREDREIAGLAKAASAKETLEIGEHTDVAVGEGVDAVNEIWAREMETFLGDFGGFETEERFGLGAEELFDVAYSCGCHVVLLRSDQ